MKKLRFRCKICGKEFEVKILEKDEVNNPKYTFISYSMFQNVVIHKSKE